MIVHAAVATPTATQTWLPAVLSAAAAIFGAWLVYRNASKANRITEKDLLADRQLAWTKQAMEEARTAKDDARTATDAARLATKAAVAAEGRLAEVEGIASRLMDWIGRVVRKAHEVDADESTPADVRELIRVINGGPPDISGSQLQRRAQ